MPFHDTLGAQAQASVQSDIPGFFKGLLDKNLFLRHLINGLAVTAVFVVVLSLIPQTRKLITGLMKVG